MPDLSHSPPGTDQLPISSGQQQARGSDLQSELDRHGISTREHTIYEWGGYRYTQAADAIAAAKRGRS